MDIEQTIATLRAMNSDGVNHVGHAADVIEALQADLRIEIMRRERKLSEADSFIAAIADTCEHAERVAAESQARENGMTEALRRIAMNISGDTVPQVIAGEALGRPSDDTALKRMLAAEFNKGYERGCSGYHEGLKLALAAERERCISKGNDLRDAYIENGIPGKELAFCLAGVTDYQNAIRALGDQP